MEVYIIRNSCGEETGDLEQRTTLVLVRSMNRFKDGDYPNTEMYPNRFRFENIDYLANKARIGFHISIYSTARQKHDPLRLAVRMLTRKNRPKHRAS